MRVALIGIAFFVIIFFAIPMADWLFTEYQLKKTKKNPLLPKEDDKQE